MDNQHDKVYSLYKVDKTFMRDSINHIQNPYEGEIIYFSPWSKTFFLKLIVIGEKINLLKVLLLSFYELLTRKKNKKIEITAYCLNKQILSYLICQDIIYHLPSIEEEGLEIGTAFTRQKYRGNGLYPHVIQSLIENKNSDIYMITKTSNISSTEGIEKAGLTFEKYLSKNLNSYYPTYE